MLLQFVPFDVAMLVDSASEQCVLVWQVCVAIARNLMTVEVYCLPWYQTFAICCTASLLLDDFFDQSYCDRARVLFT